LAGTSERRALSIRRKALAAAIVFAFGAAATASAHGQSAKSLPHSQIGLASWYGKEFHGRETSSGETFDMFSFTAAHRYLPFGSIVRVTNLCNGRSLLVRINDRGPHRLRRLIDLSYAAARELGFKAAGLVPVKVELWALPRGSRLAALR
jgi:rare lipoprotein A